MKRILLISAAVLALLSACSPIPPEPFVPPTEDELPCYITIENRTGHDLAWSIRRSSDPASNSVAIIESKGSGWSASEKHETYVLDAYVIGGDVNEVDGTRLKTTRSIIASGSYEISTETRFTHTITFTYVAGTLNYGDE